MKFIDIKSEYITFHPQNPLKGTITLITQTFLFMSNNFMQNIFHQSICSHSGTAATGAPTTTTTTIGPPVAVHVDLVSDVLTNYSSENFPVRNLSYAVEATVDLFLAGVSSLDEV